MRILFPLVGDSIGGSHRSTVLLIKQLQKSKINIEVLIHQKKSFFINFLEEHDIAYHYLEVNELAGETPKVYEIIFAIFRNYFLFRKFLKKKKIDIVHGNDLRINLSWSLITILSGRKYVWHQRTLMSDSIIWNLINFMSSHFIAISNFVMHSLPSIISDSRKSVVNNPFSREHHFDNTMKGNLIHELGINDGSKIVCYVGKLVKTKGIIELIESMQLVNQYIPSVLIVAGSGEKKFMSKLGQIILKKNLQKKIIFLGYWE